MIYIFKAFLGGIILLLTRINSLVNQAFTSRRKRPSSRMSLIPKDLLVSPYASRDALVDAVRLQSPIQPISRLAASHLPPSEDESESQDEGDHPIAQQESLDFENEQFAPEATPSRGSNFGEKEGEVREVVRHKTGEASSEEGGWEDEAEDASMDVDLPSNPIRPVRWPNAVSEFCNGRQTVIDYIETCSNSDLPQGFLDPATFQGIPASHPACD